MPGRMEPQSQTLWQWWSNVEDAAKMKRIAGMKEASVRRGSG